MNYSLISCQTKILFSRFIIDFLCYALKIKRKLFTVFHSQTNNQTKRQNNIMKQYFKVYVNFDQNDWIQYIFFAKFVYNNNKNAFTNMTSFETNLNYYFRMSYEIFFDERIKFTFVINNVKHMSQFIIVLKTNLIVAQKQQIKYKNIHIKSKSFEIDFYVMLNEKNIQTKRNKKFEWKLFDSFKIIEIIDDQIYRLKLSKRWRIHSIFYVSLLEEFKIKKKKRMKISHKNFEFIY